MEPILFFRGKEIIGNTVPHVINDLINIEWFFPPLGEGPKTTVIVRIVCLLFLYCCSQWWWWVLSLIFNNQSFSSVSCIQLILFPILSDPHHFTSVCHLPSEHQSSSGIVTVSRSTFHVQFMLWMLWKWLLLNIAGSMLASGLWIYSDHCNH